MLWLIVFYDMLLVEWFLIGLFLVFWFRFLFEMKILYWGVEIWCIYLWVGDFVLGFVNIWIFKLGWLLIICYFVVFLFFVGRKVDSCRESVERLLFEFWLLGFMYFNVKFWKLSFWLFWLIICLVVLLIRV